MAWSSCNLRSSSFAGGSLPDSATEQWGRPAARLPPVQAAQTLLGKVRSAVLLSPPPPLQEASRLPHPRAHPFAQKLSALTSTPAVWVGNRCDGTVPSSQGSRRAPPDCMWSHTFPAQDRLAHLTGGVEEGREDGDRGGGAAGHTPHLRQAHAADAPDPGMATHRHDPPDPHPTEFLERCLQRTVRSHH